MANLSTVKFPSKFMQYLQAPGGGGYSYKKRLDRKGCLFQVYEMVGNSTVEVLEKGKGNLSFPFVKVPEGLTGAFCGCEKVKKMLWFCDLFIYKDSSFTAVKRDAKF